MTFLKIDPPLFFTDLSSNLATNLPTNRDTSSPLDLSPHSTNTKSASVRKFSEKNIIFLWTGRSFGKIRLTTWTNLGKVNKFRDPSVELHEFVLPSREKHRFESLSQLIVRAAFLFFFFELRQPKNAKWVQQNFQNRAVRASEGQDTFHARFIYLSRRIDGRKKKHDVWRGSWAGIQMMERLAVVPAQIENWLRTMHFGIFFLTFKIWSTRRMTVHLNCLRFWQEYLFTCVTS